MKSIKGSQAELYVPWQLTGIYGVKGPEAMSEDVYVEVEALLVFCFAVFFKDTLEFPINLFRLLIILNNFLHSVRIKIPTFLF